MSHSVQTLLQSNATLGEGPLWDERTQRLYWVDILGHALHRSDPLRQTNEIFSIGEAVGTVVLGESGQIYLAVQDGFAHFDLQSGALTPLASPEADRPGNRFNDGKCDPGGRFWAGTMGFESQPRAGALYRLDPDHSVHRMLDDVTVSNGIAWSADHKTMYYVDSAPRSVSAFDYDLASGTISNRRPIAEVTADMGSPDGMALDVDGKLWIAHYGGSCVRRWDPETGQVLAEIPVPTLKVTACAFGGADMKTLFITTASNNQPKTDHHAGNLFMARPGVRGQATYRFADT
jgi:sugar lactone lactonase YvrE